MTRSPSPHAALTRALQILAVVTLIVGAALISPFATAATADESSAPVTPIHILSPADGAIVQPGFVITGIGQNTSWVDITSDAWPAAGFHIDNPDGAWIQPTASSWPAGTYTITFTQAADGSSDSLTVTIAPAPVITAVTIDTPTDGSTISSRPTMSGSGTPDAVVTIMDGARELGSSTVTAEQSWTYTPAAELTPGTHTLTAVQDIDGSSAVVSVIVAPTAPSPSPHPPEPETRTLPETGAESDATLATGFLIAAVGVVTILLSRRTVRRSA